MGTCIILTNTKIDLFCKAQFPVIQVTVIGVIIPICQNQIEVPFSIQFYS